jgi:hypothetical protein
MDMDMDFDNEEELAKELIRAWKEERIILLPVPIGTKVWRVHKAYIPKSENKSIYCGWEKTYVYDEEKYDLSMYNMVDIYFSEEAARLAIDKMTK